VRQNTIQEEGYYMCSVILVLGLSSSSLSSRGLYTGHTLPSRMAVNSISSVQAICTASRRYSLPGRRSTAEAGRPGAAVHGRRRPVKTSKRACLQSAQLRHGCNRGWWPGLGDHIELEERRYAVGLSPGTWNLVVKPASAAAGDQSARLRG
jgi:hypothetical protein